MSPQMIGVLSMLALFALIVLRVPVAIAMGAVALVGYAAIDGWAGALATAASTPYDLAQGYALTVVPLFILMGVVASRAGMSRELYQAANAVFSGVRGALAMATVGACAGFGAICGSSLATAATMS
ncbi:MAG: TRAP transporter large permease subunit, partial [Hyphomicrobiales bacterium]|nr:TRAP transporter large permease subunit [Hyphomicrobiales bacterium]